MSLGVTKEGSFTPDNLFAGTQVQPVVADEVVIASGAGVLTRGTVLGKITASDKCVAVDNALTNGAENIYAILAEDVDATSADVTTAGYFTGEYNESALTFGGDDTAADHKDAARAIGIFFKTNVAF